MVENTASTPAKAHSAVAAPLSLPPPPSVTRFLHPFYLINAALILCYQLVRNYHHTYGATAYSKYLGDASLSYWVRLLLAATYTCALHPCVIYIFAL